MARKTRDDRLDTRTARLKLSPSPEPYWRAIQQGQAIGYRRIEGKSGTWIARRYDPGAKPKMRYQALGSADDYTTADGAKTLTFGQAQA